MAERAYSESSYGKACKAKADAEAQARWNAMSPEERAAMEATQKQLDELQREQRQEDIQREEREQQHRDREQQHHDMEDLIRAIVE